VEGRGAVEVEREERGGEEPASGCGRRAWVAKEGGKEEKEREGEKGLTLDDLFSEN